jgi:hypothetical protein
LKGINGKARVHLMLTLRYEIKSEEQLERMYAQSVVVYGLCGDEDEHRLEYDGWSRWNGWDMEENY